MRTPQGRVIGLLIFILFMNDVAEYLISAKVFLYADDIFTTISHNNIDELKSKLKSVIQIFQEWLFQKSVDN